MIKDENLSLEDKQKLAQNLVERYLRENGYQGEIPEVLLTDEAHSFSVDSKDKETGAKRREKIYFSINDIADPNLAFSRLFGHEKAHMNTYDEGKDGEETSIHTREKIGSENKNKVFTEEEKADYLNNLRNKYKNQKSIEQQFAEAKLVPKKDKEHFFDLVFDFLTSPDYAGDDHVLLDDNSKEKLKKYGNNIYYDGYRVIGISKDGWAQLDFNDTLPDENDIALVAGISRLISHPIKTISSIKKEVKLLTDNGKGVIEEVTENDLKKLVDDTPTIKLADNVAKESTGLKETVKVGENFGKLGIYVGDEHPELKINWAATNNKRGSHALERLTERNISKLDVEYYVENGKVLKQSGRNYAFVTEKGMAVLSDDGVLITSYSSEYYDETMKEAVRRLFGK